MRLSKEDYREAIGVLKRYNYNCLNIINEREDIMGISSQVPDGMPRAPYSVSDTVFNQYVQLQENVSLQKSLKEIRVVNQAILLVKKDSKRIFEEQYKMGKDKWDIINEGISEGTYKRRHSELVYAVYEELKKVSRK